MSDTYTDNARADQASDQAADEATVQTPGRPDAAPHKQPRDVADEVADDVVDADALEAMERVERAAGDVTGGSNDADDTAEDVGALIAEVHSLEAVDDSAGEGTTASDAPVETGDVDASADEVESNATATGDVDALFDSDFDPVESVLDEVFETKASLVQHGETTTVPLRDETTERDVEPPSVELEDDAEFEAAQVTLNVADESDATAVDEADDWTRAPFDDEPAVPLRGETAPDEGEHDADGASVETPQPADVTLDGVADDAEDEPQSLETAGVAADESVVAGDASDGDTSDEPGDSPDATADAVADEPPAEVDEPSQPTTIAIDPKLAAGAAAADDTTAAEDVEAAPTPEQTGGVLQVVLLRVKAVLMTMNKPLRKLPEPMLPLIDYLALTLIMWVPIVWAIAWLVQR